MARNMLVVLMQQDDSQRAEISLVDDAGSAARLVESFLDSGYEQDRIRIFNAAEMSMQVSHRPVVSLLKSKATRAPEPATSDEAEDPLSVEAEEPVSDPDEEATPFVNNGVRFSSLFKTDTFEAAHRERG